ncbi:hypothetical protein MKHDV_02263 [Halodesulfovibrio sp. MK-HDV]|nr:hypothetical protein MKHDV_02263 [Halodesulfovibrio sp. MK-HDV]
MALDNTINLFPHFLRNFFTAAAHCSSLQTERQSVTLRVCRFSISYQSNSILSVGQKAVNSHTFKLTAF